MNSKTQFKIKLLEKLNKTTQYIYNWHELKQFIKAMTKIHYHNFSYSRPLWFYSYEQNYFTTAIEDLK